MLVIALITAVLAALAVLFAFLVWWNQRPPRLELRVADWHTETKGRSRRFEVLPHNRKGGSASSWRVHIDPADGGQLDLVEKFGSQPGVSYLGTTRGFAIRWESTGPSDIIPRGAFGTAMDVIATVHGTGPLTAHYQITAERMRPISGQVIVVGADTGLEMRVTED
jgi:hypothetical protein